MVKGYYVWCFQKFPQHNITQPFKAQIDGENNLYWSLKYGSEILKAAKCACSTVPFKDDKETKTTAYRNKVKAASTNLSDPNSTPVEAPGEEPGVVPKPGKRTRSKRPRDSEDASPAPVIPRTKASRFRSTAGAGT